MKKSIFIIFFSICQLIIAQDKGTVKGILTDKEMSGESLPFANVYIKGTSIGSTTDMDGNYSLSSPVGEQTLVFSFVGYQTIEKVITIVADKTIVVNQEMGASEGVSLDEIEITTTVNKEKESALLLEQKKATVIKESIGAQRLAKTGVSNAAAATAKISGVVKSEGSGNVYIRGMGDRYLFTTLNGLTIPSDDIDKKNINLDLFPSRVIKNLSISKTFNSASFVDQSSGHININSRVFSKKGTKLSFSSGVNTNTFDVFDNFSRSQNANITNFGFYSSKLTKLHALKYQSWNTVKDAPVNSNVSFSTSQKISLGEEDLKIFFSLAQGNSFSYRNGLFREFDQNNLRANYSDATRFSTKINTTALLNLDYKFNPSNKLQYVSMFINNTKDEVFEAGRNKLGYKFDQEPSEFGSFVRDQNIKQTTIFINQLLGSHNLSEKNELSWGVGLNVVNAKEPNRIRNEVNFGLDDELFNVIKSQSIYSSGFADSRFQTDVSSVDFLKFSNVGGYQNAKTGQFFKDNEINGYLKDKLNLISKENNEGDIIQKLDVEFGVNGRQRSREFESNRYGFSNSLEISATEIDNLAISFTPEIIESGSISYTLPLELKEVYSGTFSALAGFTNISYMANKFSTVLGLRYESDVYDVSWDVVNSSDGNIKETFNSFSPSLSLKYDLKDNSSLRFIGSITTSLPEIKELAPFQYAYPSGRVVTGNPALKPSTNYNLDLKYELFPSSEELFSVTGFYKQILDPINFTTQPGAAGNFYNENTGEKATIYGLELESRVKLIEVEDEFDLNLNLNTTLMDHKQDLSANYQYGDVTEAKLAGASNFIINAGLNFNTKSKHEFNAALTGNYTSDIVYALGAPRDQGNKETIYNDKIIEKGFTTLNLTLSKELTEKISIGGNFRNLLNPSITQTQDVRDLSTGIINNYEVSNYKKGVNISFSFNYNF